jgi:putative ABC transport system permease protein
MSIAVLIGRLVRRDLIRRPIEAVLLVLVMASATASLALALALHGVATHPYQVTRAATLGPDVVVSDLFDRVPLADLAAVAHTPGVTSSSGPFPIAAPTLRAGGTSVAVVAEGRDMALAAVDQPHLIQGSWIEPGGAVVERSFADAAGLRVGEPLTLGDQPFHITGIAVTAASPAYPMSSPGQIWVTRADAGRLGAPAGPIFYTLKLRLADPSQSSIFAARLNSSRPFSSQLSVLTWQDIQVQDATLVTNAQQDLAIGATLLALLGAASVAVLVGGRMADQTRRVGLLKAVGATPTLIAGVLLARNLVLAFLAAGVGLGAAAAVASTLANPGTGLIGAPGSASLGPVTAAAGLGLALVVTLLATVVPARRAARSTTMRSLGDAARPPRRMRWLLDRSATLPMPLLVGVRLAARRPRRAVLAAASIAITVATVVAVLTFEQYALTVRHGLGSSGVKDPQTSRDSEVLLVITLMLSLLAAINIIFIAFAAAVDSRRPLALIRAVGATPRQVITALICAQLAPALAGALIGVPLGLGLYSAVASNHSLPLPPAWKLIAATITVLAATAALTAIPARRDASRPPALILQADT